MIQKSNSTVSVNLSTIGSNIETLSTHVQDNVRIMGVVKADAYGHGATEVAEYIQPQVDAFAVNDIEEGIELREHGISKPILVFAVPEKRFVTEYRVHNLTATVSAIEHFDWLPAGTSYHLNFDTGMGRLGFLPEQVETVAELVDNNADLFCTGVYSHLATADTAGSERVIRQYKLVKKIRSYLNQELTIHIANTGGTVFYDFDQFSMVRLGIGMYGYAPGDSVIEGIQPALTWKSRLVQVKKIQATDAISYGAEWQAPQDGYIGVIPVGYEDGIKRNLSGNLTVLIGGKRYDVVGNITMNFCMVYLRSDQYSVGEKVELLFQGNTAKEWAQKVGTIPYEILTSINPKIPRTYIS
ncbi:alanine racemase [Fodinibius halophilus]|uniref:Alanine racemase n=1 Tax=Fodinibius halophilus TaxID=1736908 RepID=A0A6M1TGS9_9BACT|nr:alanine racemase [Fodinibius halophilus]NGP87860.1 alanine racemase [Fodinibius halophilus]